MAHAGPAAATVSSQLAAAVASLRDALAAVQHEVAEARAKALALRSAPTTRAEAELLVDRIIAELATGLPDPRPMLGGDYIAAAGVRNAVASARPIALVAALMG